MISDSTNNVGSKKKVEDLLNKLNKWYSNNELHVNTEKIQLIFLETLQKNPEDFSSKQVTNLGNQNLSFKPHVDNVCSQATNSLLRINQVKHLFNKTTS